MTQSWMDWPRFLFFFVSSRGQKGCVRYRSLPCCSLEYLTLEIDLSRCCVCDSALGKIRHADRHFGQETSRRRFTSTLWWWAIMCMWLSTRGIVGGDWLPVKRTIQREEHFESKGLARNLAMGIGKCCVGGSWWLGMFLATGIWIDYVVTTILTLAAPPPSLQAERILTFCVCVSETCFFNSFYCLVFSPTLLHFSPAVILHPSFLVLFPFPTWLSPLPPRFPISLPFPSPPTLFYLLAFCVAIVFFQIIPSPDWWTTTRHLHTREASRYQYFNSIFVKYNTSLSSPVEPSRCRRHKTPNHSTFTLLHSHHEPFSRQFLL